MAKKSGRAKGKRKNKKSKRVSQAKIDRAFLKTGGGGSARRKGRAGRPGPTPRAKKAYYGLLVKSYKRLKPIMQKYHPELV